MIRLGLSSGEAPAAESADNREERRRPAERPIQLLWFPRRQVAETVACKVENESRSGLGLLVGRRLPPGTSIWLLSAPEDRLKAVVRHCEQVEPNLWRVGVRLVPLERRRKSRDPVSGAAWLKWLGLEGDRRSLSVQVVDVSEAGAGLLAAAPAPVGKSVSLVGGDFDCVGAVRHCTETAEGDYRIGLLFARPPHDRSQDLTADWID